MKVLLLATRGVDQAPVLSERLGASMLPLLDRPFLQHGVECLVRWGATEIDFILCHLPEKVEAFFGTGERWGCRFRYHLVRDPERPFRPLANALASHRETPLVLADGEVLPLVENLGMSVDSSRLLMEDNGSGETRWSGWAVISSGHCPAVEATADATDLEAALINAGAMEEELPATLTVRDPTTLLHATRTILDRGVPHLMHTAREVEEKIWLSRDVGIHPTARITPPVYLDEGCRIGKLADIGPYAVLGKGCVVDEKTCIRDSVVLPMSYIGKDLSLEGSVVDKNCLVNTSIGSELTVTDAFIIGNLAENELRHRLARLGSRITGVFLLVVFSPLLITTLSALSLFRKGPCLPHLNVVSLPTLADETHWHTFAFATCEAKGPDPATWEARWWHFFLVFLPGLIHVVRGRMRLVGLGPRTTDAIRSLPEDWRHITLTGKGGLITEAMLHFGPRPGEDELYAAETVYTVSSGPLYDAKLLLKYAGQLLGVIPRPGKP
ncbi:NDP-sugar synthase [Desulfoluna spongiiphila]|uniref:NDP-sugar pyrophosphorylase, includes eIF-2Bgamma, eIF-2Bepsilon, and LPS biosynthesis proteins n=1 Tax=Desulfoluna spongiiphila TaxID=419481 RepID=A0A1G5FUR4_9BACT|nr:NDP-sugar synthase [Desulfoluna spongiiphila]SCY42891.1 NDP-sugar pyrophosphorylase, includes eIF-2Bgamma, eIF-2Bepsilon, and LPS biosynthesis proteins [Desulfoluna spongiiphila]VVS91332.1 nucleotide-diphospho-sugar transferases [Desulfoluna spongiiphila]